MWEIKKIVSKGEYLYAVVKKHPHATKHGYVLLHRIIMENCLERILEQNEVVHHKDGNKKNNLIENLELSNKSKHAQQHQKEKGRAMVEMKCPNCRKIFIIRKGQSHLQKPKGYDCCCRSCRGILSRQIQLHGKTKAIEKSISENLIREFRSFEHS